MSDLVERLKIEASEDLDGEVRESAIEVMREAATALTAKDKEIEAVRERVKEMTSLLAISEDMRRRVFDVAEQWQARAETAERERDCHKQMADKNYALWAEVSRERDEARAAVKAMHESLSGDRVTVNEDNAFEHFRALNKKVVAALRAARTVIEQGE